MSMIKNVIKISVIHFIKFLTYDLKEQAPIKVVPQGLPVQSIVFLCYWTKNSPCALVFSCFVFKIRRKKLIYIGSSQLIEPFN